MTIPVYVITGFLGSGKTTLLNRVLAARAANARAGKIALVVNELGEVGIDGDLLPADAARQIELPGGCVCCLLGPELDRTLIELADRNPELVAIVLETTGVAEPLPIAWSLEREPLAARFRLGAVVTVVDTTELHASRPLSPSVDAQIAYADVLVLSKAALATPSAVDHARAVVRGLAPRAPILDRGIDEAAIWLEEVLAEPEPEPEPEPGSESEPEPESGLGLGLGLGLDSGGRPAHGIASVWLPIDDLLDLEELEDRLADLPSTYIRIKGLARVIDGRRGHRQPHWAAFHRVGLRVSSEPIGAPRSGQARVVALGPHVTLAPLAACLVAAVVSSTE